MVINKIKKSILILTLFLMTSISNAQSLSFLKSRSSLSSEPLSVDQAFKSEIEDLNEELNILFDIAPNHYLYKDKIELKYNGIKQNNLKLEQGEMVYDEFFGETEIYKYGFSFKNQSSFYEDTLVELKYQGCSKEFNLCYPPKITKIKIKGKLKYKKIEIKPILIKEYSTDIIKGKEFSLSTEKLTNLASTNDANAIIELINDYKNTPYIYLIFIVLGIFIAFTPCIYPLMPIVIASTSRSKNRSLATISYIMGMVFCYTLIGLVTGYLNFNIQIFAQNSYFVYGISLILFILAMYMIGFINVILPSKSNEKLSNGINKLNPDKYSNQFLIGFLSSLVLSPCSIAPLLGVLIFINQLGEPIFGSILLANMAIGIGIPIFLLSTSFNKFMPKNGAWMTESKNIIGIVILSIMIYLLTSEIGETISYLLYSLVFMIYGLHLLSLNNIKKIGVLMFTFSLLMVNYKLNEDSKTVNIQNIETEELLYTRINDIKTLNDFIKNSERPIFIDYYADWCITCVRMNETILKNSEVIKQLNNNYFMVKIDLTDITSEKQTIMDEKNILAIPYYSLIENNKKEFIYTGELEEKQFKELLTKHSG